MIGGLKWGLLGGVVAGCVGFLVYSASGGSSEYYLTVSELRAHATSGDVRVAGVEECLGDVGTDESGAPGDQDAHQVRVRGRRRVKQAPPFSLRTLSWPW